MRGKLPAEPKSKFGDRITPADAGKTRRNASCEAMPQDHPRGCGENRCSIVHAAHMQGSPPRMRGKPSATCAGASRTGITPADAGKTMPTSLLTGGRRDHPRGCGENSQSSDSEESRPGSPPRMRGKRYNYLMDSQGNRITPADAGKTLKRSFRNQPFCS